MDHLSLMTRPYAGKTVLLTGAGGCIGSALTKALVKFGPRSLVLLDSSEQNLHEIQLELASIPNCATFIPILGNICDDALLTEVFKRHRPEIVYHSAAFKHVPLMEMNPVEAIRNNAMGTFMVSEVSKDHRVETLVMISTDKAVNPCCIMGASKRIAELVLLQGSTARCEMKSIRLGNVLGSHGSVVPLFHRQISRGGPVTVTQPGVTRYFLNLSDAVELILAVGGLEGGGGIFIPDMGEPVKIIDLARQMIREAGLEPEKDISIVFTGLREGDKMTEQLMSAREISEPTSDPRLRRVCCPSISPTKFDTAISELAESVRLRDLCALVKAVCQLVPEYRPSTTLLGLSSRSES